MEKFYTSLNYFADLFDNQNLIKNIDNFSLLETIKWQSELRKKLKNILSIDDESFNKNNNFNEQILEEKEFKDYTRKKVIINTSENVQMPMYILIPKIKKEEYIPLIACHGHCSSGKSAVVNEDHNNKILKNYIEKHNYSYAIEFAKRGYMVFCPDARGFGERREYDMQKEEYRTSSSCCYLNNLAIMFNKSLAGLWVYDLIKLVDYIETINNVDIDKICCVGLSGGGYQTLMLAAVDERIKFAITSGYFYGFKNSILKSNQCSCNYIPGLWEIADISHIGALIAPRCLFIETGANDKLNGANGLENVIPYVDFVKDVMKKYDKKNNIYHYIFDGDHCWSGEKIYSWLEDKIQKS